MADLWIRHMHDAYAEDPSDETKDELEEFVSLRDSLAAIYTDNVESKNKVKSIPKEIEAYLSLNEPDLVVNDISVFNEAPLQFLVKTSGPMKRETAEGLDQMFNEGMIVLDWMPI